MKVLNSKSGFTLIELLVVIGILAVLAAIAIPSVAGLIDRANVSADKTNAAEYTNAMERFMSEYELYRQDIASGLLKDEDGDGVPDNMDAAQGRVYNVTGAKDMDDIRALESVFGLNGKRVDIDTKQARNRETAQAVIKNYTKTSSDTFNPKQSDMAYWYNTNLGYTICAPKDIEISELVNYLPSDVYYNPNSATVLNEWIDLASEYDAPELKMGKLLLLYRNGKPISTVNIQVYVPNIKNFGQFDASKFFVIKGKTENGILTMENYEAIKEMGEAIKNSVYADDYGNATDEYVLFHVAFNMPATERDTEYSYRICYEIEIDGQVQYIYSSIVSAKASESEIGYLD